MCVRFYKLKDKVHCSYVGTFLFVNEISESKGYFGNVHSEKLKYIVICNIREQCMSLLTYYSVP